MQFKSRHADSLESGLPSDVKINHHVVGDITQKKGTEMVSGTE